MSLEDPKATFKVVDSFESFSEVEKKVAEYVASHYVKFWKRDAKTIEAARVDRYLNPRLKYYQLKMLVYIVVKLFVATVMVTGIFREYLFDVQCILTYPNPFGQEKKFFVRISEKVLQKVLMRHEYH